jgi:polyphosphate kinase
VRERVSRAPRDFLRIALLSLCLVTEGDASKKRTTRAISHRDRHERDEEEADDLLTIESELRDRRFAPTVRLEVGREMSAVHRGMLAAEFGLDERADVFEVDGMMGLCDLMEVAVLEDPVLHDPPHHPVDHPRLQDTRRNVFHIIRDAGSLLLAHPYESFATLARG